MTQPNPSIAQARAVVDELARHGLDLAIISPGSRSAAMAIAFEESPGFEVRVVLDERGAVYQAVGHARATGVPAVCLSTSGTAVANYLPGVVEADAALVPVLVVSADRPPESRGVAANQTIDQVGIFGDRVRWFCDLGLADSGFDGNGYWRSSVSQAVARARGHGGMPGPVHLNMSFREPTVPVSDDGRNTSPPYPHSIAGRSGGRPWIAGATASPGAAELSSLSGSKGVVIAGEGDYSRQGLLAEAARLGWPVLATALSGLRGAKTVTGYHHILTKGLPASLQPDVVVSVGRTGPSDRLAALTSGGGDAVQIDRWGKWIDPRRETSTMLAADPAQSLATIEDGADPGWAEAWHGADQLVRPALDECLGADPTGPAIARLLANVGWESLVVASSMPVRDVDAHLLSGGRVLANRGASGIDGFVSTAVGVAARSPRTVALSGDLSFLHDASALAGHPGADLVLVVIDNNGGGLFDLLPQARHAPSFEKLFIAPHDLDLAAVGAGFGHEALAMSSTLGGLDTEIEARIEAGGMHVLVVPVDREVESKQRRELDEAAVRALAGL
jgi:2-succinyl-5-enolpyruvyl-6-hydroxy-3-cyclohexene-1-carboxylate synthase